MNMMIDNNLIAESLNSQTHYLQILDEMRILYCELKLKNYFFFGAAFLAAGFFLGGAFFLGAAFFFGAAFFLGAAFLALTFFTFLALGFFAFLTFLGFSASFTDPLTPLAALALPGTRVLAASIFLTALLMLPCIFSVLSPTL